ncbi:hypothetical protein ACWEPM_20685 [Streptomyces sp. NPDC004244]|uniref:hypothetical protein n=1 Tax=Streptomyces sp. NPDC101206 TaxID=3366128 RepID=UPI003826AED8
MNQPVNQPVGLWTGQPTAADRAPREPVAERAAAASSGAHPPGGRPAARHRKSSRPRRLAAGLALVSVVTATAVTMTVDPAAPAPDGRPHSHSAR